MNYLFYGIFVNALMALLMSVVVLYIIGFIFKLLLLKISKPFFITSSFLLTIVFSTLTFIFYFQKYCSEFNCSGNEFLFGLITVVSLIIGITMLGYFSIKLGYGKPIPVKQKQARDRYVS